MIEKIQKELRIVKWDDFDSIIQFYENNILYFDNYSSLTETDSIKEIIDLKLHYINALIGKKRYSKALPILDHVDNLIQKLEGQSLLYKNYKEAVIFRRGMIYGYLKEYSKSVLLFSQLRKIDNDNDLYKNWYSQMRINLISKRVSIFGYIGFGIIAIDLFGDFAFDFKINNKILLIGLTMAVVSLLFPYLIKLNEKLKAKKS